MSKLKAVKPKSTSPRKPKILVFGKAGVGKTWASLDFPSVYYIDTEGGATREHYSKKLEASGGAYFGVEQGSQDFSAVVEEVKTLATEKHEYKTLVIDSLTKIYLSEIAKKESEKSYDAKSDFGAAKKPATRLSRQLINWLDRIDMNVIIICHEKPLWADGQQIGVTFDGYDKLDYELDLCLNIGKTGETRKAHVKKSRLEGFPDSSNFPWSYDEFAKRYGKDVIESQGKEIVLATPEQIAEINRLLEIVKIDEKEIAKWFAKAKVESWDEMSTDIINACINNLKGKIQ